MTIETPLTDAVYDSAVIANRFLDLAGAAGDSLTPMKLLKLVYIAHGWHLGLYHRPLIRDDVQAWQYGPVIPRLYSRIRKFRGAPVSDPISAAGDVVLDPRADSIVRQVYDLYGHMTGAALSRITHAKGTPWELLYEDGRFGVIIPNDLIEDHYSRLAEQAS